MKKQPQFHPELIRNANSPVHLRPTEPETLGMGPAVCVLRTLEDSEAHSRVKIIGLDTVSLGRSKFSLEPFFFFNLEKILCFEHHGKKPEVVGN